MVTRDSFRNKWIGVGAIFLLLAIAVAFVPHRQDSRVGLQSQAYNFGSAKFGDTIKHTFELYNPNNAAIAIKAVTPSCSCTVLENAPTVIAAHSKVEIPVQVHLNGDSEDFGAQVAVFYEKITPTILVIRGKVTRQYPAAVFFGEVRRGREVQQDFYVKSVSKTPLRVTNISLSQDFFEVNQAPSEVNPNDVRVTVKLRDSVPNGNFEETLTLRTDDPNASIMDIVLKGYVTYPLEFDQKFVTFGLVEPGQTKRMDVKVFSSGGEPIEIKSINVVPADILRTELISSSGTNSVATIAITITPSFQGSILEGHLDITAIVGGKDSHRSLSVYATNNSKQSESGSAANPSGNYMNPSTRSSP